jgi:hypothetical protein
MLRRIFCFALALQVITGLDALATEPSGTEPIKIFLAPPVVHNCIFESRPIKFINAQFHPNDLRTDRSDALITATLSEFESKKILFKTEDRASLLLNTENEFSIPAPTFEAGIDLLLEVEVTDANNGDRLFSERRVVKQLARTQSETLMDEDGNIFVNGKPFFPIGMYAIPASELKAAKEFGFNTAGIYMTETRAEFANFIKEAEANGVAVIKHAVAGVDAHEFEDSPALIGYYISDEPAPDAAGRLEKALHQAQTVDPYHLRIGCFNREFETFPYSSDVMMPNVYPLRGIVSTGTYRLEYITSVLIRARAAKKRRGSLWFTPQAFPFSVYGAETYRDAPSPTYHELRTMTWLGIAGGAKGVIYYIYSSLNAGDGGVYIKLAYPLLWESLGYVVKELNSLADIAAMKDYPGQIKTHSREIQFLAKIDGADVYLIAANPGNEARQVQLTIEGLEVDELKVISENRLVSCRQGEFNDMFLPRESHIYTTSERQSVLERSTREIGIAIDAKEALMRQQRERNLCLAENGAALSSSWGGFPQRKSLGGWFTWYLMNDGFDGTFWLVGFDNPSLALQSYLKDKGISYDNCERRRVVFNGDRWIEVKFQNRSKVGNVRVVAGGELKYEVQLFKDREYVSLSVGEEDRMENFYKDGVESTFEAGGLEADGLRLILLPTEERRCQKEFIFEIQAFE